MRGKVILAATVLALAALAPAFYLRYRPEQAAPPAESMAASDDASNAVPPGPSLLQRVSHPASPADRLPDAPSPAASLDAPGHEEYATERKAELYQMGVERSPASLGKILVEVHNPDPGIRQIALKAAMDFGSKDAIPTLRDEMAWAEDPHEKAEIQEAIDFLQVPPFELDENGSLSQH